MSVSVDFKRRLSSIRQKLTFTRTRIVCDRTDLALGLIDRLKDDIDYLESQLQYSPPLIADPEINRISEVLSEREFGILAMRYGLLGYPPQTLDFIGKQYGVTRERVRQVESRALAKLRDPKSHNSAARFLEFIARKYGVGNE